MYWRKEDRSIFKSMRDELIFVDVTFGKISAFYNAEIVTALSKFLS